MPTKKSQPSIIRDQADIPEASMQVLVDTFNALTGKSIKKFESRAIAEARVANAILSAQAATGARGVVKGARPTAKTRAELDKSDADGGSLRERLSARAAQVSAPPLIAVSAVAGTRRAKFHKVRATGTGTSKPRLGSIRHAVLEKIQAAGARGITVEALEDAFEDAFDGPVNGYLGKLWEKGHIVAMEDAA